MRSEDKFFYFLFIVLIFGGAIVVQKTMPPWVIKILKKHKGFYKKQIEASERSFNRWLIRGCIAFGALFVLLVIIEKLFHVDLDISMPSFDMATTAGIIVFVGIILFTLMRFFMIEVARRARELEEQGIPIDGEPETPAVTHPKAQEKRGGRIIYVIFTIAAIGLIVTAESMYGKLIGVLMLVIVLPALLRSH